MATFSRRRATASSRRILVPAASLATSDPPMASRDAIGREYRPRHRQSPFSAIPPGARMATRPGAFRPAFGTTTQPVGVPVVSRARAGTCPG